jgi:hypothetical protein
MSVAIVDGSASFSFLDVPPTPNVLASERVRSSWFFDSVRPVPHSW